MEQDHNRMICRVESVTAGYDDEVALIDVSLDIYDHDFIGVIGPNGGGKTTLLKVILGMIRPMKGKVTLFPSNTSGSLTIGYLPQYSAIDKNFPIPAIEVCLSGFLSRYRGWNSFGKKEKRRAHEVLGQLGIAHLADKPVGELSGGQLQRVLLSRAIISCPELLILDEPGTFVDNKFEGELYETLRVLNSQMAILMVSHDLGIISTYVKTIACVNRRLNHHLSNLITEEQLAAYDCPIKMITHGDVPHTVLHKHN